MADEIAGQNQAAQQGISLADKNAKEAAKDSGKSGSSQATSNDFLSSNGTLNNSDNKSPLTVPEMLQKIVDVTGTVKPVTKNGITTVTVQLNPKSDKNKAFLEKAAGPLQDSAKTASVTFTISKDGKQLEEAKFSEGDLQYTLTLSKDSKITSSTVLNSKNPDDLENNYTVMYGKDAANKDIATVMFANYQNDGSIMTEFSQNGSSEISLKFFADSSPDSFFRTITLKKDGAAIKSVFSQLNFEGEPPITEYSASINAAGNIALSFDTSYGTYSAANIGTYSNLYDLLQNKIGTHLGDIQTRENFLLAFEQMMGWEKYFTLNDLINKIRVANIGRDEDAVLYAELNFKGYPIIMTTNIDPATCETVPLILTPDTNKNGKVDAADRRAMDALKTTVKNYFDPDIIAYKDFAAKAIFLDAKTVFYDGQVISIYGRGRFAYLRYKGGESILVYRSGKSRKVHRHTSGRFEFRR